MVRDTSIEAYREIRDNGLLSRKRLEVYDILYRHGPLTGAQVSKRSAGHSAVSETVRNRITELRDMGAVTECGTVDCPITGKRVILWDVTANLPTALPTKKTKKDKIEEAIKELRLLYKAVGDVRYKDNFRSVAKKIRTI